MTLEQAKERALVAVDRRQVVLAISRLSLDLEALGMARYAIAEALRAIEAEGGEDALRVWIRELSLVEEMT